MLNLSMFLEDSARKYPSRDALVLGEERLTYAETDSLSNQIANLLVASGITPGDRVAMSCPNLPWFPIVYYGILKAGAVVVPLNILLKSGEIAYHLQDCGATAYFCFEGGADLPIGTYGRAAFGEVPSCHTMFVIGTDDDTHVEGITHLSAVLPAQSTAFESVAREATDTAVILYTSGTTGRPKGAELTHSNMTMNAIASNRLFDNSPSRPDTHLATLPLFHSFGQTVNMNAGFSVGATLVLLPRFEAGAALEIMERESITMFAGVPTMYWGLLGAVDDAVDVDRIAANLRKAISGGAPLPVEILERFATRFGVQILEAYGLSETSPIALFSDPEQAPRAGSIGVPIWGVQVRLIDPDWNTVEGADTVGEIAIRGHNVMKGYYDRPDATDEAMHHGWFRTGDLARRDADGFYFIVDRAKDMIVRGGFNVYPREIEEMLITHPAVSLAAVIGVPHEQHGEEIKAFVIPEPGAQISEPELITWCKERIAAYKYPRSVEFVTVLPMTATGKLLKRELSSAAATVDSGR
ncbi:long-chain fatty acid--CoA ligase [Rhodococcus pseudokoreensis]|uniref:Long-chain fatty acid--CoA ligase n=1 Tax=Rhodococcus pseudokoreensis TaxID=2811421 RepID=A0A974ZXM2_9NOCA|nr:long-chain fatty acid--CoA ligase [Rhodococcus pseudokoreensis]QSE93732.1 long-chain fatty acid--CoA ligase [Rhodococcus pseudokoreensis]